MDTINEKPAAADVKGSGGRVVNYDLMRFICIFFVIAIHISQVPYRDNEVARIAAYSVFFCCNGIFYMISGRFNLNHSFDTPSDYYRYYVKKFCSILMPFVLFTAGLIFWQTRRGPFDLMEYVKRVYVSVMNTNSGNHMWFMYPLFGMLVGAPFFAKMLRAMKDWEVNLLLGVAFTWSVVRIYLVTDMGVTFSFSEWFLADWSIAFFGGYYCHRMINNKNKKAMYIAGGVGLFITILAKCLIPEHFFCSVDLSPVYVLYYMALYTFLEREVVIRKAWLQKAIFFVGKHSFSIYLFHMYMIKIAQKLAATGNAWVDYFGTIFLTFVISLAAAVVWDTVLIFPLERLGKKILLKHSPRDRA